MKALSLTSTDQYQAVPVPSTVKVNLQVSGAAIDIGFGVGLPGSYQTDETFLPVIGSLQRRCDEIRIKSHAHGQPAVVFLTALTAKD